MCPVRTVYAVETAIREGQIQCVGVHCIESASATSSDVSFIDIYANDASRAFCDESAGS